MVTENSIVSGDYHLWGHTAVLRYTVADETSGSQFEVVLQKTVKSSQVWGSDHGTSLRANPHKCGIAVDFENGSNPEGFSQCSKTPWPPLAFTAMRIVSGDYHVHPQPDGTLKPVFRFTANDGADNLTAYELGTQVWPEPKWYSGHGHPIKGAIDKLRICILWMNGINPLNIGEIRRILQGRVVPSPAPAPVVTVATFHAEIQRLNAQIAALTQENLVLTQRLAKEIETRQVLTEQLAKNTELISHLIQLIRGIPRII